MNNNSDVVWVDMGGVVWVMCVYVIFFPYVPIFPVLLKLAALCASILYHATVENPNGNSHWNNVTMRLDFLMVPLWGIAQLLLFVWGDTTYMLKISIFFSLFHLFNTFLVALMWNNTRHFSLFVFFVICFTWIAFRVVSTNGVGLYQFVLILSSALLYFCAWCVSPIFYINYQRAPWHSDKWGYHCDFHVLLYMADTALTILSLI